MLCRQMWKKNWLRRLKFRVRGGVSTMEGIACVVATSGTKDSWRPGHLTTLNPGGYLGQIGGRGGSSFQGGGGV